MKGFVLLQWNNETPRPKKVPKKRFTTDELHPLSLPLLSR